MYYLAIVVIVLYALAMLFIFMYSFVQLHLLVLYLKSKKIKRDVPILKADNLPLVTVQLPVYNELYVVEKLIECVANFDYPKQLLEVQILDDSSDETSAIIEAKIKQFPDVNFQLIRRPNRSGYKAGALAYGTAIATGEFIAIFDADFQPSANFLQQTLPYFTDAKVGVVQSKWEHINEKFSLLTRLQAFGLNAHFTVEQGGRNFGKHFINFNGTAGIWRKSCIADAGGWQSDTLTEDLDLSYRAQLKHWQFVYLENLGSPAELPVAINALKTQQFRWTKGAAECAVKNLPKVLRSENHSFSTKTHAVFHLLNSSIFLAIFILGVLSVPLLWIKITYHQFNHLFTLASIFSLSFIVLAMFYAVSALQNQSSKILTTLKFMIKFPLFLAFSMGLSLHNALAVWEGLIGKKSAFIRTPKFNIQNTSLKWWKNPYLSKSFQSVNYLELLLSVYFMYGLYISYQHQEYALVPILLFLSFGYLAVLSETIQLSIKKNS